MLPMYALRIHSSLLMFFISLIGRYYVGVWEVIQYQNGIPILKNNCLIEGKENS